MGIGCLNFCSMALTGPPPINYNERRRQMRAKLTRQILEWTTKGDEARRDVRYGTDELARQREKDVHPAVLAGIEAKMNTANDQASALYAVAGYLEEQARVLDNMQNQIDVERALRTVGLYQTYAVLAHPLQSLHKFQELQKRTAESRSIRDQQTQALLTSMSHRPASPLPSQSVEMTAKPHRSKRDRQVEAAPAPEPTVRLEEDDVLLDETH